MCVAKARQRSFGDREDGRPKVATTNAKKQKIQIRDGWRT